VGGERGLEYLCRVVTRHVAKIPEADQEVCGPHSHACVGRVHLQTVAVGRVSGESWSDLQREEESECGAVHRRVDLSELVPIK
jgi:hypothetical protein